jgi:hypothetical protein
LTRARNNILDVQFNPDAQIAFPAPIYKYNHQIADGFMKTACFLVYNFAKSVLTAESFHMPYENNSIEEPNATAYLQLPLHLQNPWSQEIYRLYQAKLKYGPPLIALDEEAIRDDWRALNFLRSDKIKAYLADHPEQQQAFESRKKAIIRDLNHHQAAIANHYSSLKSMRDTLIRYGFLDVHGNSLFEPFKTTFSN